jgi:hypothetical protein
VKDYDGGEMELQGNNSIRQRIREREREREIEVVGVGIVKQNNTEVVGYVLLNVEKRVSRGCFRMG